MGKTKANKADAKKIVKIVLNVLLWIFLVFAFVMMLFAFASISNDYGVPVLGKKVVLTVASDSMKPTFEEGDMLIGTVLTDEDKAQLKEGDIISFFVDLNGDQIKEVNTHRIVSIADGVIKTKGDNNSVADSYNVYTKDVISIWKESDTRVKGLGKFFAFLQGRIGFLCVIVIPLALFFIYEIIRFVITIVKLKGGDKKKITAEDEEEIRRKAIEEYLRQKESENVKEEAPANDAAAPADEPASDDKE